jgi:hypothetical protein
VLGDVSVVLERIARLKGKGIDVGGYKGMGYAVATGDELLRSDWARRVKEREIGVEVVDRALLDVGDVWKVMSRVIVVGGELQ